MNNRLKLENLRLHFLRTYNEYSKINENVKLRKQTGKDMFGELLLEDARNKLDIAHKEYFEFWQNCIKTHCLEQEVMYM